MCPGLALVLHIAIQNQINYSIHKTEHQCESINPIWWRLVIRYLMDPLHKDLRLITLIYFCFRNGAHISLSTLNNENSLHIHMRLFLCRYLPAFLRLVLSAVFSTVLSVQCKIGGSPAEYDGTEEKWGIPHKMSCCIC